MNGSSTTTSHLISMVFLTLAYYFAYLKKKFLTALQ